MADIRITGGELRGRRLYVPKRGVRPTTGRVREGIFSMLGPVEGARVLDLFCGSGALGIEALSRGAAEATFVDKRMGAVARNLEDLGISKLESGWAWQIVTRDVGDFLFTEQVYGPMTYELILCDPPYTLAADFGAELEVAMPRMLADQGRLVLETAARQPLDLTMPLAKEREYGDTLIRIYANE